MTRTCPNCGAEVEYTDREVRLRTGTCAACSQEFTFVEGAAIEHVGSPPAATGRPAPAAPAAGPECEECGNPFDIRSGPRGTLEVSCAECGTKSLYFPKEERVSFRPGPSRELGRPKGPGFGAPRSRPCRQCGAPLTFTTGEDGNLVGECASCGNRFTLPPRPEGSFGRRAGGGPGRFRGRGGAGAGPRRLSSDDRRGGSRPYRAGRNYSPRDFDQTGDEGERPRRRRPRTE